MSKNRLALHYVIGIAALAVFFAALYLLYQDPGRVRSLILTIVACALVAVGQFLIIRKNKGK